MKSVTMSEADLAVSVDDGVWYPTCPHCGIATPAEPDADYIVCSTCDERFKIDNPYF